MKKIILALAISQRTALRHFPVLLSMMLLGMSNVFGQTIWNGTISSDWSDSQNWSNEVPDASTDVNEGGIKLSRQSGQLPITEYFHFGPVLHLRPIIQFQIKTQARPKPGTGNKLRS
jgi:hypothetical protein